MGWREGTPMSYMWRQEPQIGPCVTEHTKAHSLLFPYNSQPQSKNQQKFTASCLRTHFFLLGANVSPKPIKELLEAVARKEMPERNSFWKWTLAPSGQYCRFQRTSISSMIYSVLECERSYLICLMELTWLTAHPNTARTKGENWEKVVFSGEPFGHCLAWLNTQVPSDSAVQCPAQNLRTFPHSPRRAMPTAAGRTAT